MSIETVSVVPSGGCEAPDELFAVAGLRFWRGVDRAAVEQVEIRARDDEHYFAREGLILVHANLERYLETSTCDLRVVNSERDIAGRGSCSHCSGVNAEEVGRAGRDDQREERQKHACAAQIAAGAGVGDRWGRQQLTRPQVRPRAERTYT